ncbi:MAG: arginase [Planctomycetes bacterium]|nr:arginase [Planctomycetota bacterium]
MIRSPGKIDLIGVPMDLGSDLRGVDMGPSAIRIAGVAGQLAQLGYRVRDLGNLEVPHAFVAGQGRKDLKFVEPIRKACAQLAAAVAKAKSEGAVPLVLGGDHSIAMGTLAGLSRHAKQKRKRYGLLWVDAHGDCNTPKSSPSGNIHGMPLAVILGSGDARLAKLGAKVPMIDPKHTVLFGVRNLDPGERKVVRKLGLRVITMRQIDERGVFAAMKEALHVVAGDTDGFHLSFDIDSVDPRFAPGVGTPVLGGLTVREAHLIMELVADSGKMVSCELVEVNPVLDQRNITAQLATHFIYSAFGGSIL